MLGGFKDKASKSALIAIMCVTNDPTVAPTDNPTSATTNNPKTASTNNPTNAPTLSATLAPSLAPAASPTACIDYANYSSLDGIDNITAIIFEKSTNYHNYSYTNMFY